MRSDSTQLDLYRHSPDAMGAHFRAAAETARLNPWETPDACEQRAKFYEEMAGKYEAQAGGKA